LHRHYMGKHGTGLLWMFTGGLITIGSWYDFFTLPSQVREANIRNAILDETIRRREERGGYNQRDNSLELSQNWRNVEDGQSIIVREKEPLERVILKLAKSNNGIITASDLALSASISMEDAKKDLDAMVNKGFAELRVRQSGAIVYAIPDLINSDEPLID